MKALTLYQPWASLIAAGVKTIETRSWPTRHRGPIAIHAAKTVPAGWNAEGIALIERYKDELRRVGALVKLDDGSFDLLLPAGAVVAVANLWACGDYSVHTGLLNLANPSGLAHISDDDNRCGSFGPGRFGWVLDNIVALPEPVPVRGKQGLWQLTPREASEVLTQIRGHPVAEIASEAKFHIWAPEGAGEKKS